MVTPAVVATEAPTATDVAAAPIIEKPRRAEPAPPAAPLSSGFNEVPALKPQRPRWLMLLGVAAALGLGVVGLRSLDRPPTATPESLARPITKAKPLPKSTDARPKSDDDGDDGDDGDDPNTGNDSNPDPTPPDPDPLKAKPAAAQAPPADPAPAAVAAPAPAAAPSATAEPQATGSVHINVLSDPPGARMFWKGKEVGTTPFVLEFQPGDRHAYEVGLPGYTTRKVVIDGSKTEITIGLRPDSGSGFGSSP
jgi:PEGA domain